MLTALHPLVPAPVPFAPAEYRHRGARNDDRQPGGCLSWVDAIPREGPRVPGYQCTPRISAAKAICSWLGADSLPAPPFSPLAAAESGNSSNAVFMITS